MTLAEIAGSKTLTKVGLVCTGVGTALVTGGAVIHGRFETVGATAIGVGGVLGLAGGVFSALGKALGDQRTGTPETGAPTMITLPDGTEKPNERGRPT